MGSRLETRLAAGATVCEVDFVGCGAPQRHVWPIAVVPRNSQMDFAVNRAAQQRYPRRGPQALLQCPPKAFDDSNAACLADSTESLTDVVMAAAVLQAVAGKLLSLVRDQVPGGCADLANHLAQKTADLLRGRLSAKAGEAKHTSRVMIQYHSQPPAERPALRQRERQPRGPEPSRC